MKTLKLSFLLAVAAALNSHCFGQWNELDLSGTTTDLKDIFCTHKDTCYAVGMDGYILKTTDGGSNWTQLNSGTTNYLTGVHFMSSNIGIVVGDDIILKTTDAGTNWAIKPKPFGSNGTCVHFYGDSVGYVGGPGGGEILKTTDAGESWNWSSIIGPNGPVFSLFFTDKDTGYAAEMVLPNGRIWKTNNGGSSWTQIFSYPERITDVYFVNNTIGYAVGYSGVMFKTTDAGNNWDTLTSGTAIGLNAVFCLNEDTCYAVGYDNTILQTTDGGTNWTSQSITPAPGGLWDFFSVFFAGTSGYAVGTKNIGGNPYAVKTDIGTGTATISKGENIFSIYPNPIGKDKRLHISLSDNKYSSDFYFKIYNILGNEARQIKINSGHTIIDISNLKSGMYAYILTDNSGVAAAGKIIIQ